MGTTATVLSISFTIVCALGIAFVIYIARSTRTPTVGAPDDAVLAEREKAWFGVVVVVLVTILVVTIFFTPYGRTAAADARVEKIEGLQFAWIIPSKPIVAGREVEFKLTSADVVHGFAVYSPSGTLLFEVQVTPGETSDYVYTFKDPGTYKVVCLEYCGVGHTAMQNQLTVVS